MLELTRELLIQIHMANGMTREQSEAQRAHIEAPEHKLISEEREQLRADLDAPNEGPA